MRRTVPLVVLAASIVIAGLLLAPSGHAVSQELRAVRITNFPDPQRITGTVEVGRPVPATALVSFPDVTVPPVPPEDTNRLVHAGSLQADGFDRVVLSLVGQAQGKARRRGAVGVLLLPDEPRVRQAFLDEGKSLVPIRLETPAEAGPPAFFGSQAGHQTLAFPTYQVYLYNTTDTAVIASVHAYLGSG